MNKKLKLLNTIIGLFLIITSLEKMYASEPINNITSSKITSHSAPLTRVLLSEKEIILSFMGGDCDGAIMATAKIEKFESLAKGKIFNGILVSIHNEERNCSSFRILKEIEARTSTSNLVQLAIKQLPQQYWKLPVRIQLPQVRFSELID